MIDTEVMEKEMRRQLALRGQEKTRAIPQVERDRLILESDNVHDLRPVLEYKIKQRQLAIAYRKPITPDGPTKA